MEPTKRATSLHVLWLLLILLTCTNASETTTFPVASDSCHLDCTCIQAVMKCDGFIPYAIPDPIQELQLTSLEVKELQPQRFCHLDNSWNHLTSLAFDSIRIWSAFSLSSGVFDCLGNLASFRLKSGSLNHVENFTFAGLTNVTYLDLSGCSMLNWDDLYDTFSLIRNFPKLDHLILSGVGSNGLILDLDDAFIDVLSMRPLEYLDLSYTNIMFSFENSENICTTLDYFSYAGASVQYWSPFNRSKSCGSLRILDISKVPSVFDQLMRCVNVKLCIVVLFDFFKDVDVRIENEIILKSSKFVPSNCSLVLYNNSSFTEFHFTQNYLPNFDILLINDRIQLLNLSQDNIADINPKAFESMRSLSELDLSCNELSKVTDFRKRFSELFSYSSDLTYVYLNDNELQYLPNETFVSNLNIEHLDLSNNSLTQVDFAISHLLDLKILNLGLNNIETIDETSRRSLDALYANQIKANKTETVQVQLHGNPLSCHCACLGFLQWLVNAPMFSATRHEYKCQLDGRQFLLDSDGVNAAKEDCERERQKRLKTILLSTLLPSAALIVIVTSILLYKRHKKNLLRQQFADGIRRLRRNADRFPVFLSYSSEDKDFVRPHMLQPMQDHLNQITGLNRELVCNADLHFHPAKTILSEIFHWVKKCEVLVAVMSENYCKSKYCRYEIEHAHLLEKPIILVFIEHVPKKDMNLITREVFETFTRVQFEYEDGEPVLKPGWKPLCESIVQLICKTPPRNAEDDLYVL